VVLGAIYLLWMFQKVFFGKLDKAKNGRLPDLDRRELATFIPLVILIFLLGLFPRPLLAVMEPSVKRFIGEFNSHVAECDGPPHIFGITANCEQLTAPKPDPTRAAAAPGKPATPGTASGSAAGSAANAAPPAGAAPGAVPNPAAPGSPPGVAPAPAGGAAVPGPGTPTAVPAANPPAGAPPAGAPTPGGAAPGSAAAGRPTP
jgi:NADH-quinone oxidoreductase subunit M